MRLEPKVGFIVEYKSKRGKVVTIQGDYCDVKFDDGEVESILARRLRVPTFEESMNEAKLKDNTMSEKETQAVDDDGKVKIRPDLEKYEKVKLEDGTVVHDRGDDVAVKLRGLSLPETAEMLARQMLERKDVFEKDIGENGSIKKLTEALQEKYAHLNPGQQRMNLGNRLRGLAGRIEKFDAREEARKEREEAKAKAKAAAEAKAAKNSDD